MGNYLNHNKCGVLSANIMLDNWFYFTNLPYYIPSRVSHFLIIFYLIELGANVCGCMSLPTYGDKTLFSYTRG